MTEPTPRYRALIQLLRTAEDLWNASRIFFAQWDLSPSQFNVLNLLRSSPEGMSQSDLSRQLIMHRSNVTGLVDRLERRGLVRRTDDSMDRRAYRVVLSPAGVELLSRIYPRYFAAAEEVWAGLPDAEIERFLVQLRQLARQAEAIVARQPSQPEAPQEPNEERRSPRSAAAPATSKAAGEILDSLRTSDL